MILKLEFVMKLDSPLALVGGLCTGCRLRSQEVGSESQAVPFGVWRTSVAHCRYFISGFLFNRLEK